MAGWQRQPALVRAVNAMMRALGGGSVTLRVAAGCDGSLQRELGITASAYQETELSPVIVRQDENEVDLLISSTTLDSVMAGFGSADGLGFLRLVRQIVYGDQVFTVADVSAERFAGVEYLYRVKAITNTR